MKYLATFIVLFGMFCVIISSAVIETGCYHLRIGAKYVSVVCNEKTPKLKLDDIDRQHPYSQIFEIKNCSNSVAILWTDNNSGTTYSIGEEKNRLLITDTRTRTDKRWYVYQEKSPPIWVTKLDTQQKYICMYFLTRWGRTFSYLVSDSSGSISLTRSNPGKDRYTFVEHISSDSLQATSAYKLDSETFLDNQHVTPRDNQNVNIHQENEESMHKTQNQFIELSKSSEHKSEEFETPNELSIQSLELETETEELLEEDELVTQLEQDVNLSQLLPVSIRSIPKQESSIVQSQESETLSSDNVPNFPSTMKDLVQILPY